MHGRNITHLALLTGMSLTLFMVETALPAPIPVPGAKLGLANAVTVWTVYRCRPSEALMVLISRILLGALLTGNLFAIIFSLSGGLLSLAACLILKRFMPSLPMWQSSAFGGVLHNAGQLIAAVLVSGTRALIYYAPLLIIAGMACGSVTGLIAQVTASRLDAGQKGSQR